MLHVQCIIRTHGTLVWVEALVMVQVLDTLVFHRGAVGVLPQVSCMLARQDFVGRLSVSASVLESVYHFLAGRLLDFAEFSLKGLLLLLNILTQVGRSICHRVTQILGIFALAHIFL